MRAIALIALLLVAAPSLASAEEACDGRLVTRDTILGGSVCVPASVERVVVLDPFYNLVMGRELGLPIVGAATAGLLVSSDAERADGIASVGTAEEPSFEAIAALDPDLILGDAFLQGRNADTFAAIAPTALVATPDWKDYYRTIAAIAGAEETAEANLAAYEARAAAIRAAMPDVTVSFVRILPGAFQVYVDGPSAYGPFAVLRDAGVVRPPYETVTDGTILKRPDWESLRMLEGDVLLYVVSNFGDGSASALEEETTSHPLWRLLPAVRHGRAHRVDIADWVGFGGLASAHRVLDDVERLVLDRAE